MPTIAARSIKLTVVLDAVQVRTALAPLQKIEARIPLAIEVDGRTLTMDFAPKGIRRCFNAIVEHGVDGVAVILQGRLGRSGSQDVVLEAGLVAQPKTRQPAPAAQEAA
jgi:hypothetical protein